MASANPNTNLMGIIQEPRREAVLKDRSTFRESTPLRPDGWQRWSGATRRIRMDTGTILYHSLLCSLSFCPPEWGFGIAKHLGRTKFELMGKKREPLRREMEVGLGTTREESVKHATRVSELALWEDLESYFYSHIDRGSIERLIQIRGLENLDTALLRGKGAILCTGHIRGLFIFIIALSLMGYKVNVIRRAPRRVQGPVGRWFNRRMTLIDSGRCNYLWMHENNLGVAVQAGNALRRQELVIVLIDARFGSETQTVHFLQHVLPLPTGHIVMAQACAVPLINFFVRTPEAGLPRIAELAEPYYPTTDVAAAVQYCVSTLERNIRRSPADWMWYPEREVWSTPVQASLPPNGKKLTPGQNCDQEES